MSGTADIYFTGHDHLYDNSIIAPKHAAGRPGMSGLYQLLVGTAGANLDWDYVVFAENDKYIRDPALHYFHNARLMGYLMVTVSGNKVDSVWRAFDVNGDPHWYSYQHITSFHGELNPWSYTTQ